MNKQESCSFIEEKKDLVLGISHKIWEYAETSLKEYKSADLYKKALAEEGFSVEDCLCGIDTAFCGSYGSGKPVIGILAEFDALSGLSQKAFCTERTEIVSGGNGHGCGHNMLGAASFGAALGIKHYIEENHVQGTVIFFGCPGEEGGASKALLAREGVWNKLDAALTWHPGDANEVSSGTCNSCVQVIYSFKGIAAHAAGDPENGRSALDALELMNVGVQFLREHVKSDARIHYSILNAGGISPNVVQPTADVLYMIRSNKVKDVLELEKRVDKIAEGAAMMTETEMNKTFVDGCSDTKYNTVLQKLLYKNMSEIPCPEYSEEELEFARKIKETYRSSHILPGLGAEHDAAIADWVKDSSNNGTAVMNGFVIPLYTGYHFSPGSTDVGDVSYNAPTAQFDAATWPSECPGHSWQNVSCGNSSLGDKGLLYAAKVLCGAAIDLLADSNLVESVKSEFAAAREDYFCPVPQGAKLYVIG